MIKHITGVEGKKEKASAEAKACSFQ